MEAQVILTRLGNYSTLIWRKGDLVRLAIPGRNKYKKLSQKLCTEVYDGFKCGSFVIHEDCEDIKVVKILCGM